MLDKRTRSTNRAINIAQLREQGLDPDAVFAHVFDVIATVCKDPVADIREEWCALYQRFLDEGFSLDLVVRIRRLVSGAVNPVDVILGREKMFLAMQSLLAACERALFSNDKAEAERVAAWRLREPNGLTLARLAWSVDTWCNDDEYPFRKA